MIRQLLTVLVLANAVDAQCPETVASGFQIPTKISRIPSGRFLVAEGGGAPNSGAISILAPGGASRRLLEGLPSGLEAVGVPQGPTGIALVGRALFLTFSGSDVTVAGAVPGTEAPNPMGPSSPLASSVLKIRFSHSVDHITSPFGLTLDGQLDVARGATLRLSNQDGQTAKISLLADFRDLVRDPTINVRRANPFGIVLDLRRHTAWVVDSSQNSIEGVNLRTGRIKRLIELDSLVNPLPFGPPLIDPVPTSIRLDGDDLLVSLESGFPFPAGGTTVQRVAISTKTETTFLSGLTAAIDVIQVRVGARRRAYVLELSTDLLADPPAPGRLLEFVSPGDPPTILCDTLNMPTSLAFDPSDHSFLITEVFAGNVVRVRLP